MKTVASTSALLLDKEAPEYLREISITTGYRQKLSYRACVSSWFWLHNETVNIWSHFIGFLIFFYNLASIVISPPERTESNLELLPLIIQLISYQVCMLSSTLFHTFSCHSEEAHDSWQETDHLGILCALFGTYVSLLSIVFDCFPSLKVVHISLVVVIFIYVIGLRYWHILLSKRTSPMDHSPKIPLRIFLAVSVYSVIPLSHWVWLHGGIYNHAVQEKLCQIFLPFVIGGVGLVFYVTRFPEKMFKAGSVDILGSSHQVWHVMIFLGMAFWYKETSSSFMAGSRNGCSSGADLFNETDDRLILSDADGVLPDSDNRIWNLVKTFVKLIYLEETLHFCLEEIFNIF